MSIYGFLIGISFVLGINYFQAHNRSIPPSKQNWFFFGLIVSSLIGARLYHVFDYWSYYSSNPSQILNTPAGGLGIYGGIIAALIFIITFCRLNHLPLLPLTDLLSSFLPLGQAIGRFGNYFNHEVYSPSGQPVWLFESLSCLVLFLLIRRLKSFQTAVYLIGYGLIRFFLEFLRHDTWQIGHLKIAQVISLVFIACGLMIFFQSNWTAKKAKGKTK